MDNAVDVWRVKSASRLHCLLARPAHDPGIGSNLEA